MSMIGSRLPLWSRITPNVSSDGSLVLDQVTGVSSSGAGFFAHQSVTQWDDRRWGQVDLLRHEGDVQSCRGFCSVPGPLQSVQRAEMWGVILALQSSGAVDLGVDNLCVVRHVGRLLDGHHGSVPFDLVKDGDLLLLTVCLGCASFAGLPFAHKTWVTLVCLPLDTPFRRRSVLSITFVTTGGNVRQLIKLPTIFGFMIVS